MDMQIFGRGMHFIHNQIYLTCSLTNDTPCPTPYTFSPASAMATAQTGCVAPFRTRNLSKRRWLLYLQGDFACASCAGAAEKPAPWPIWELRHQAADSRVVPEIMGGQVSVAKL